MGINHTHDAGTLRRRPDQPQQHAATVARIAKEVAAAGRVPAISVAVAGNTGIYYAGAVGYADLAQRRPATPEDQYPWFSMTKIATATAAMRLHAQGALDLDAPIGVYLSAYRPHPKHGHPTMRHLLTHTAGLGNPMPIRWIRAEHDPANPTQLEHIVRKHGTPRKGVGARAVYSNIGYLLAANVVEAVTGRAVEDVVSDAVLEPMGMTATGYRYRPDASRATGYARLPSAVVPALRALLPDGIVGPRVAGYTSLRPFLVNGAGYGGLIGTVTDAARFAAAHAAGVSDAHPLLNQVDLEAMRAITHRGKRFDHGIGWFRKPTDANRSPTFVEHYGTGGGFWNAMRIYPEDGLAMVAMANTTAQWNVDNLFTTLKELTWT
jgi:CubicO group peptidase (beta-lactamase class C family)